MRCRPPPTRSPASSRPARSSCACAAASPSSSSPPAPADEPAEPDDAAAAAPPDADEGATARINLRLPEQLKAGIEEAAGRERLSVNAWLVRAAAAALARDDRGRASAAAAVGQRFTGWVR